MEYRQLTTETVPTYLRELPELLGVFSSFDDLHVEEVGDGNLNFVYKVHNRQNPAETVVVKQAVPFLRIVGESWPLSRSRMNFEIEALAHQAQFCPQHVPQVFHASKEMSLVVMQNLNRHAVLRGEMIQGKVFPKLADHVSTFLANTLFPTTDLCLSGPEKKALVAKFINPELCQITEQFVLTDPYEDSPTNVYHELVTQADKDYLQQDEQLKVAVAEMKYAFMNHAEALLHGDLHIGSIMANEEETFMIDPEFAFFGPIGFDVGAFIGNLFLAYFAHEVRQQMLGREPYEYRSWILRTAEATWHGFHSKFEQNWLAHEPQNPSRYWSYPGGSRGFAMQRRKFLNHIFTDMVGFAACKMMRRIYGLAKVADIAEIPDLPARLAVERNVLRMGKIMVTQREQFHDIEELTALANEISPLR
jgi:5-methylthioribose kinase